MRRFPECTRSSTTLRLSTTKTERTRGRVFASGKKGLALFVKVALLCIALSPTAISWGNGPEQQKRPITVADAVAMTTLEATDDPFKQSPIALFSPDGKQFVVVVRTGNVQQDTNDFSILLYKTAEVWRSPKPDVLLKMSSSSIRDAITNIRWLPDNETLVFLGENPDEKAQLYTFNVARRDLKRFTSHSTTIYDYAITDDGSTLVYRAATPSMESAYPEPSPLKQLVIEGQSLFSLLRGDYSPPEGQAIFCQVLGGASRPVPVGSNYFVPWGTLSLSPNGRYAVFPVLRRDAPPEWAAYRDKYNLIQQHLAAAFGKHQITAGIFEYLFVDTSDMSVRPLVGTPVINLSPLYWAKDSASVFLSSYLPLDVPDPVERRAREQSEFPIQVKFPSAEFRTVGNRDFPIVPARRPPLDISVKQDLNTPPKIHALDTNTKQEALLFDLNPQFADLNFGIVKTVEWEADGIKVIGGLYLPPDYEPGKKYPLVIQTHGFEPAEFSMDGRSEWSSGFAARPLASKGILVLQLQQFKERQDHGRAVVANDRKLGATREEAVKNWTAHVIDSAVKRLDESNLIDRDRVGIVGFSVTVCYVGYVLTHSQLKFAAASLVDGISCGYFEAIGSPDAAAEFGAYNGNAAPFGEGLKTWLSDAPGFNLDKVQVPVRLVALGPYALLSQWEWYTGLTLQKKPVELVLIPHGTHLGGIVSARMLEEQGLVDWFSFWLQGKEDPDPAKRDQYSRWEALRNLRPAAISSAVQ